MIFLLAKLHLGKSFHRFGARVLCETDVLPPDHYLPSKRSLRLVPALASANWMVSIFRINAQLIE